MTNKLKFYTKSLRQRIFISMLLLTLFSSILISIVSIIQFKIESQEYHEERLSRKENAIKQHIEYILKNTKHNLSEENIFKIFRYKIFELSDIHGLELLPTDRGQRFMPRHRESLARDQSPNACDRGLPDGGCRGPVGAARSRAGR